MTFLSETVSVALLLFGKPDPVMAGEKHQNTESKVSGVGCQVSGMKIGISG
jgi:hypothetical protein